MKTDRGKTNHDSHKEALQEHAKHPCCPRTLKCMLKAGRQTQAKASQMAEASVSPKHLACSHPRSDESSPRTRRLYLDLSKLSWCSWTCLLHPLSRQTWKPPGAKEDIHLPKGAWQLSCSPEVRYTKRDLLNYLRKATGSSTPRKLGLEGAPRNFGQAASGKIYRECQGTLLPYIPCWVLVGSLLGPLLGPCWVLVGSLLGRGWVVVG